MIQDNGSSSRKGSSPFNRASSKKIPGFIKNDEVSDDSENDDEFLSEY